jgi:hypothetical protein
MSDDSDGKIVQAGEHVSVGPRALVVLRRTA